MGKTAAKDLTGMRFGRLEAILDSGERRDGRLVWLCECDCGNRSLVKSTSLISGVTRSCGCLHAEKSLENLPDTSHPIGHEVTHKQSGYTLIKTEDGMVRKHRHVMEKHIGRKLLPDEVVHHIDEDKTNNKIENLEIMAHGQHTTHHSTGREVSEKTRRRISRANKQRTLENGHRGRKLSSDDVILIRKRVAESKETNTAIARRFGVTKSLIGAIAKKRIWRNV